MAEQKAVSVENLQEAMLENNTKMKEWVNTQLGKFNTASIEWVDILPTKDISTTKIYMLKNTSSTKKQNIYDEYVYNETTGWEILGQVDVSNIDMSDYYNKKEIDELLKNNSNYTDEEVQEAISAILS
jgi:hypothetical protein